MSLPMPLAAPVTMATFFSRRMWLSDLAFSFGVQLWRSAQVIVDDLAEAKRQISNNVRRRDDFEHWKLGDRSERVGMMIKRVRQRRR
jgi:hypothetical protein